MRRVIKPFTVEIRGSGRKSAKPADLPSSWPVLDDQPAAAWPEAFLPPASKSVPVTPVGRVLPDLNEVIAPAEPAPTRAVRRPQPQPAEASEPAPGLSFRAEASAAIDQPSLQTATEIVEAALDLTRRSRQRLTREDFGRAERWKARLPIVVHRFRKTRGTKPNSE